MSTPRRAELFTDEKIVESVSNPAAISSTSTLCLMTMDGDYFVEKFEVEMPGGYTANDSAYYTIALVSVGSNLTLASATLQTTAQTGGLGNLTDAVFITVPLTTTFSGTQGDQVNVVLTKTSSGANIPAGSRFVMHARQ